MFLILPNHESDLLFNRGIISFEEESNDYLNEETYLSTFTFIKECFKQKKDLSEIIQLISLYRKDPTNSGFKSYDYNDDSYQFSDENLSKNILNIFNENQIEFFFNLLPKVFENGCILSTMDDNENELNSLQTTLQKVQLSRLQIVCLLSCMLIGAIQSPKKQLFKKIVGYDTSLREWIYKENKSTTTYCKILNRYFNFIYNLIINNENYLNDPFLTENIYLKRVKFNNIQDIIDNKLFTNDLIIDLDICQYKMEQMENISETKYLTVFCNKDIGYGSNATQEEIIFGLHPELLPFTMLCYTLKDDEIFTIDGALRFINQNEIQFENRHISFKEEEQEEKIKELHERIINGNNRFTFLFMDALEFDSNQSLQERSNDCIVREIIKAYTAFSQCPLYSLITTGFWGCGAFMGTKDIKMLIQIIAASLSNVKLLCCTFKEEYKLPTIKELKDKTTLSQLLQYLIIEPNK